ncbi:hypothetical protein PYJP_05670 [Pyrofollis japonicus]|uniref:antitoxin family protein n=1 Tax=Pyrofollis japonicus TaxID=3060460 RepID=UPI00295BDDD8|nr:antitoxin family protein [Pyrofollis japonicus]BEP17215.1 hypothetical protein PYJP_05670 [Pyrofollis japonicus]
MSKVIRVRYEKGVLKPLDIIDFEEGEELVLEIKERHRPEGVKRFFGIVKVSGERAKKEEDYYEHVSERGSIPGQ